MISRIEDYFLNSINQFYLCNGDPNVFYHEQELKCYVLCTIIALLRRGRRASCGLEATQTMKVIPGIRFLD
jgi:hypothetical protein